MRKYILLFLLGLTSMVMASTRVVVTGGNAIELQQEPLHVDIVYIFENLTDAVIETGASPSRWCTFADYGDESKWNEGVNYIFPENNTGYVVQTATDTLTLWVIDYSQYKPSMHSLEVNTDFDNQCEQTELLLEANIPAMSYQDTIGGTHAIKQTCTVSYMSLSWDGEAWQDSLCVSKDVRLSNTIRVDAPLQNTTFTLTLDQFADELGFEKDSICTIEYEAVAVDAHPTTITTTRGADGEISNEVERPIEDTQLSGSAPLDIYFKTNATPAAKYYTWQLLRGSTLIAQRTDAEQRYKFEDYGEYVAKFVASNDYCSTDTLEVKISVATSQLLVPNVFTPNGDGKNDEFRVMYRSIVEFHCWVYNRWGHLVYEWTDPAKGWDGTINGRPAAESAYFYVIRARGADYDPNATPSKKIGKKKELPIGLYELKGDINLIRGGHK